MLPVLAAGALWWCLHSQSGSAWLLGQVPGLRVTGAKGALVGDFEAGRVELALPRGGVLAIDGLRWQGLRLARAGSAWRLRIDVERLAAARVDLQPGAPSPDPLRAPDSLALPVELQVRALQVQALHAAALGETPLRGLQAALHLGADDGTLHRVDGLEAAWGRLRARGSGSVGSQAPLPVQARLALRQEGRPAGTTPAPPWEASATLAGTLAALQLRSTLQAQAAPGPDGRRPPAQSLDLNALLRPFEAWPLGDLQARARSFDLSALHSAAPVTALSGEALIQSQAYDRPATAKATVENSAAGRWNEGRLPLQRVQLELAARPDDPATFELRALDAELGTTQQPGGRLQGRGRWTRDGWTFDATLSALQPSRLDARAATMRLAGPLQLAGSAPGATPQTLDLRGELSGQLAERGPARAVRLKIDASARRGADGDHIVLHDALASAGGARASLAGTASRSTPAAPWQLKGRTQLTDFDPLPWWPGRADSPWRRGPHRLNAGGDFDLALPRGPGTLLEHLAALRGQATLRLADSVLAGVPLRGEAIARSSDGTALVTAFKLEAGGNQLQADGRIATRGTGDRWTLSIDAPALAAFAPVWRLLRPELPDATLAGTLVAQAQVDGRWPALSTSGRATATGLRVDRVGVLRGEARWQAGTGLDSPVEAEATLSGANLGAASAETVTLKLQGSGRSHRAELRAESKARPPAWVDALQAAPSAAAAAASAPSPGPTVAVLQAQGGLVDDAGALAGWRGTLQQIELRGGDGAWLRSRDVGLELLGLNAAPLRVTLQPGRAELLGAVLRWSRVAWQAGSAGAAARLEAQAELEPITVAPLLARLQPDFGWGGDLRVAGRLEVASAPSFHADVVLERERGDLTVTDETGTQALGLTDLRLGLNVADGVWSFTQGLAGSTLGVAAGAFVARTSPQASWPAPDTPVSGVLELRVANLGTWGTWVPAGWRLGGALRVSAGIGGSFGGPEFTGDLQGSALSVRNFVQGVNVSDGEVAVTLQGASARIERFSARAGAGSLQLEGDATLGTAPQARLRLTAQKFQLLGRVDRRIVASGEARLQLERDRLQLDGQFGVDEGLIDFTRSDAPSLGDDVTVRRGRTAETGRIVSAPGNGGGNAPLRLPSVTMDLRVALGEQLRLRGRGLDTRLAGELRLTSPGGRLAVNGTVRALDGTYAAYGQKLTIDRGELSFNGSAENPRLDIEATRPNLDVRVGVAVTGSAANPRVRLFSEPELSEIDKLSWLVLGRASDGLGRTDTALLQRAALALLSGDREGPTDQLTKAIGLDEVSVRQTDGEVRETVVSLGKQLSRRWYVGYERGLNATTGTWQLIYRIAQRFTLRAQSGDDSSLDVIWTWRWN